MHSDIDAFAYIHTHFQCCIWYKVHSCAFECILFWLHFLSFAFSCIHCTRCIHVHSLYVAFYTCRILTHSNTFSAWCILNVLHSTCDAFRCNTDALLCIPVHLQGGKIPDFDERRGAILLVSWCLRMHMNAHECVRMRQNAPEYTRDHTHTYTREAERTQGQTHMDGYGLDGLWACHKARHKSTHVPLHVIQVFIFRLGCECICVH